MATHQDNAKHIRQLQKQIAAEIRTWDRVAKSIKKGEQELFTNDLKSILDENDIISKV